MLENEPTVLLVVGVNGVGKTTTIAKLANRYKNQGKKVLLVDIDPQGNSTSGLGIDKRRCEKTIYNCLIYEEKMENVSMYNML